MLQVISGKFYFDRELLISNGYCLLYSNFFYPLPIKTSLFSLKPINFDSYPYTYLIEYKNIIEKEDVQISTRIDDCEIINQIVIITSFAFKSYFSLDRKKITLLCNKKSTQDRLVPLSNYVFKYFDEVNEGSPQEIVQFQRMITFLKNMPREDYEIIFSSLKTIYDSIGITESNLDLAYSMLIYSLESISQKISYDKPDWKYYDPTIKKKLEIEFKNICRGNADRIIEKLLESDNQRATQKFTKFIEDNTHDSFFITESWGIINPVKKIEYFRAIKNAYDLRSKYVHELRDILKQLKVYFIAPNEVFFWENKPYFTYRGLLRVCNHVIKSFIETREIREYEKINWKNKQSRVVQLPIHPKHTIFLTDSFIISQASRKYSEFLDILKNASLFNEEFVEMEKLLLIFETNIIKKNVPEIDKIAMFAIYFLFNSMVKEKGKMPHWNEVIINNKYLADICNIQNFPLRIMLGLDFPWKIEEMANEFFQYIEQKFNKNGLVINDYFESLIVLSIGNMYFTAKNFENYLYFYQFLLGNNSGNLNVQKMIIGAIQSKRVIRPDTFVKYFQDDGQIKKDLFQSSLN